jgi:peptidoglycan/LPS O-acetylase OafA/YrhL
VNDTDRTNSSRVPALDLLQLVAVGAVILYHYGFWGPASHGFPQVAIPAPVAQYGFLGVPVFFAISGFVIAYSAEGRNLLVGGRRSSQVWESLSLRRRAQPRRAFW